MYLDRIPPGILSEEDISLIRESGWGKRRGFGTRPAVLVVDAQYTFVGAKQDTRDSMKTGNAMGIGNRAWDSVAAIARLIANAREMDVPVVYCRVKRSAAEQPYNWGMLKRFTTNEPKLPGVNGMDIVAELAPKEDEIVLDKCFPSAFFGTPLHSYLTTMGIDTLLVTGFVTSGCIRATVNDSCENGFRTIVVEECVADRFTVPHVAELLTMDLKYADVVELKDALKYLAKTGEGKNPA